ncbi:MAG: hypothetical protein IT456_23750 [Planctomycetes bacterium]|nr:hypothetical protein [Planctomycetota bacterium]
MASKKAKKQKKQKEGVGELVRLAGAVIDAATAICEYRRMGMIPGWLHQQRKLLPADCVAVLDRWRDVASPVPVQKPEGVPEGVPWWREPAKRREQPAAEQARADAVKVAKAEREIFDKWLADQAKQLRDDLAAYVELLEPMRLQLAGIFVPVKGAGPFTVSSHAHGVQMFGEAILSAMVDRYYAWDLSCQAVAGVDPDALRAGVEVEVAAVHRARQVGAMVSPTKARKEPRASHLSPTTKQVLLAIPGSGEKALNKQTDIGIRLKRIYQNPTRPGAVSKAVTHLRGLGLVHRELLIRTPKGDQRVSGMGQAES